MKLKITRTTIALLTLIMLPAITGCYAYPYYPYDAGYGNRGSYNRGYPNSGYGNQGYYGRDDYRERHDDDDRHWEGDRYRGYYGR